MKSGFREEVFSAVSRIHKGKISTYKETAEVIGNPKAIRAVGQALKSNKNPDKIPCYRVVRTDGSIGGYCGSGQGNIRKKIRLLEKDGINIVDGKFDLHRFLYRLRK